MAPLPRTKLEKISEVLTKGFKIVFYYGTYSDSKEQQAYLRQPSNLSLKWALIMKTSYNTFIERLKLDMGEDGGFADKIEEKHPKLLESLTPEFSRKSLSEKILECIDTVYLTTKRDLDLVLVGLHEFDPENAQKLYCGQDDYMSFTDFWIMGSTLFDRNEAIHVQFQSVLHSGIYDHLRYEVGTANYNDRMRGLRFLGTRKLNKPKPLTLQSGFLLGVFIITAVGIGASMVVSMLEIVFHVFITTV